MKWRPANLEELAARGIKPESSPFVEDAPTPEASGVEQVEEPVKPKRRRKKE
jgi:hypothetical protein